MVYRLKQQILHLESLQHEKQVLCHNGLVLAGTLFFISLSFRHPDSLFFSYDLYLFFSIGNIKSIQEIKLLHDLS